MGRAGTVLAAVLALCLLTPADCSEPCTAVSCPSGEFCFRGSCVALIARSGRSHPNHPHHSSAGRLTVAAPTAVLPLLLLVALGRAGRPI